MKRFLYVFVAASLAIGLFMARPAGSQNEKDGAQAAKPNSQNTSNAEMPSLHISIGSPCAAKVLTAEKQKPFVEAARRHETMHRRVREYQAALPKPL
jgi:hypothetical protein